MPGGTTTATTPFFLLFILALQILLLLATPCVAQPVVLGPLVTRQHLTAGTVAVVSERILEIRGFAYDGMAPEVYFWADENPNPSSAGIRLLHAPPQGRCGKVEQAANGMDTHRVEFPPGKTIRDFAGGSISVWCERFDANFGEVVVDQDLLNGVPVTDDDDLDCFISLGTPDGYNCEPLNQDYQVRWKVLDNKSIAFDLIGRIAQDQYLGFGPSGSTTKTQMIGSDPVLADFYQGQFRAIDFFMSARGPCSSREGVCPDTEADSGANDVENVTGKRSVVAGATIVRYVRPLAQSDSLAVAGQPIDATIMVAKEKMTFVTWAIGPISPASGLPMYHQILVPTTDVSIEFGRDVTDNCTTLTANSDDDMQAEPFRRPVLSDVTEFTARIGPSGGERGVEAITGQPGWGIAWFINDQLIPEIRVRRGQTYTFKINGGDDPSVSSDFHPFYITSDRLGGFNRKTAAEQALETLLAGVTVTATNDSGVAEFEAPFVGPICKYTSDMLDTKDVSYEDFIQSVDTSCGNNQNITSRAAELQWTPDENTPDTVYYQCVTHPTLGWKIQVEGRANKVGDGNESDGGGDDTDESEGENVGGGDDTSESEDENVGGGDDTDESEDENVGGGDDTDESEEGNVGGGDDTDDSGDDTDEGGDDNIESGDDNVEGGDNNETNNDSVCFPGSAIVELQGGSSKYMSDLIIGDLVRTGPGVDDFGEVYFFSHKDASAQATFVNITVGQDLWVTLSPSHYLIDASGVLVAARHVRAGMLLQTRDGRSQPVTQTTRMQSRGLFAPHTLSKTDSLVVNGVLASEFTQAVAPRLAQWLLTPIKTLHKAGLLHGWCTSLLHTRGHWIASGLGHLTLK